MRLWKMQAISPWLYFPHHITEMLQWPTFSDMDTCYPLNILLFSELDPSSVAGGLVLDHWREQMKVGERFHSFLITLFLYPLPETPKLCHPWEGKIPVFIGFSFWAFGPKGI